MTATVDNAVADLQRANAELQRQLDERTTERDEALERETATAEVLQVINSSPGDLAPVFEAILEKAHSLCDIAHGVLALYDGEYFRAVATRGYPEQLVEVMRQPFHGNDFHQRMVRGERYVHIPDVLTVASQLTDPVGRALAEYTAVRTQLLVPLRKDGKLLGHISGSRVEVRPFSEKEIALLQNFAAQAVIAMENARLITETREALEQQTATAEVLGVINSSPGDLAPVFDAMLEKALRLGGAAHGHLALYDGEVFRTAAVRGKKELADWFRQLAPWRAGTGTTVERIIAGERIAHIADVMDDDAYRQGNPVRRALVEIGGCRTALSVALRRENALLGVFTIYRQEVRPFSDKQIALLDG